MEQQNIGRMDFLNVYLMALVIEMMTETLLGMGGYNPPKDDEFYLTTVVPYGNGKDFSEM